MSLNLMTKNLPDPDFVIRTSGEKRLSNFLLWQIAYSELYFTKTLWPDFTVQKYMSSLKNYISRKRRSEEIKYERIDVKISVLYFFNTSWCLSFFG